MESRKTASEVVALLDLKPFPDGGFYLETFRDTTVTLPKSLLPPQYKVDRTVSSALYFLLPSAKVVRLHRMPCAETWHYYMGEPLTVFELQNDGQMKFTTVGSDLGAGHRPQYTVQPNVLFGAFLTSDVEYSISDGRVTMKTHKRDPELHYSLVGVTCAPAYEYDDDEFPTLAKLKDLFPNAAPFLEYLIPS